MYCRADPSYGSCDPEALPSTKGYAGLFICTWASVGCDSVTADAPTFTEDVALEPAYALSPWYVAANWYVAAGSCVALSVTVPLERAPFSVTGVMPLPVTVRVTCPVGTGVVPVAGATVITAAAPLTVGLFTVIVVFEAASGAPT